jgi:serine/threonine protein kinase
MAGTQPWDTNWNVLTDLDPGGQGLTYRVESRSEPGRYGVLKKLKNNKSTEARGRMFREVTALRTLATEGVKVPHYFDGNTDQYEDEHVQLYFVMEEIPGETLRKLVDRVRRLPLDQSLALLFDLCTTISAAHKKSILHRDLKPENIIVRDLVKGDVVIVDYGLSFNQGEQGTVTVPGETFRNKFLDLPETNTNTSDLRDPRSDVTAIVAILFYCLTGHAPGQLRDGAGLPPHRRPSCSVSEALGKDPRTRAVDLILDMGFTVEIGARFASVDELAARLRRAKEAPTAASVERPEDIALEIGAYLRKNDRTTQIAEIQHATNAIAQRMAQYVNSGRKFQPFAVQALQPGGIKFDLIDGVEKLNTVV